MTYTRWRARVLCSSALLLLSSLVFSQNSPDQAQQKAIALRAFGSLPMTFEENHGQADAAARFLGRGPGYTVVIGESGARVALFRGRRAHLIALDLGSTSRSLQGELPQVTRTNYFHGSDASGWIRGVPHFARVRAAEVYPGIDLLYYGNQRNLEFDYVVRPGADPRQIALRLRGADRLRVNPQGDLVITAGGRELLLRRPIAYQESEAGRTRVRADYVLAKNEVRFVLGDYDRSRELVIDPTLSYSTYLGGAYGDVARDVALDSSGNAYITGTTNTGFPVTPGAYDAGADTNDFTLEGWVAKLNPSGSALLWATYLGGSSHDEPAGIAVTPTGSEVWVAGTTWGNFPTTAGAPQTSFGGNQDAFLARLTSDGGALHFSTYWGGASSDLASGLGRDPISGDLYVAGTTSNAFPTTSGAFQRSAQGGSDGFVAKFMRTGDIVYSTIFGGNYADSILAVSAHSDGTAYVGGICGGGSFPMTSGAQDKYCTPNNGFIARLNANGSGVIFSSALGLSNNGTTVRALAVDSAGNVYATGETTGSGAGFPTTANAAQRTFNGGRDAFISKLSANGSQLLYSTLLGGSGFEEGYDIALDSDRRAYVVGQTTQSPNFPVTADALRTPAADPSFWEGFLTQVSADGSRFQYSTLLGGSNHDHARAVAVLPGWGAAVTGYTSSGDFPTTAGAYDRSYDSSRNTEFSRAADAFVSRITFEAETAACEPPSTPRTVRICQPADGATVSSPVRIVASAAEGEASTISRMNVWVDGVKRYEQLNTATIDTSISMSEGTHRVTVQAADSQGTFKQTIYITVSGEAGGCEPPSTARTVRICTPADGATVNSPVHISAAAQPGSSEVSRMNVWVDGVKKYEVLDTTSLEVDLPMSAGTRRVTVQAADSAGTFKTTIYITVQ